MSARSQADTNSVSGSWINGPNIQIGSAGNVTLALGRSDHQVQWLQPTPRDAWVPRRQRTPSYLLDARREVVPFWPRPQIQETLVKWRDDLEDPASVLLVHGPGGRGKTRLANAFAGQCHELGWAVSRAVSRVASPGDVLPEGPHTVPAAGRDAPVLVVVDYAERWPVTALAELIQSLVNFSGQMLRVLMLARSRGQVWQSLGPLVGRQVDLLDPVELGAVAVTREERQDAFNEAATAFQTALDLSPTVLPTPELTHNDYSNVLLLHMAALAAVTADRDNQARPSRADLSGYLLDHEQRHWPLTGPTDSGVTLTDAANGVLLATLFGPLASAADATALLAAAGTLEKRKANAVLAWHDTLYPQDASDVAADQASFSALAPLRPDRFGEDFVAQCLTDLCTTEWLHQLLSRDHNLLDGDAIRRCLQVLASVADRHERTRGILWALLANPELTARISDTVIHTAIDHAPLETCRALEDALPDYRSDLVRAAAALTEHILRELPRTTSPATMAFYLNNLGNRLADAGDRQGALVSARKAVAIYRALAKAEPTIHLAMLAMTLSNLGSRLADAGDKQAALTPAREAVAIRRALAKADPGTRLPSLVISLTNLGAQLSRAGHKQAALAVTQEAVDHNRGLAESNPAVYRAGLATSLNNLGSQLASLGHRSAALEPSIEAVNIRRALAEADPAAYRLSLATSLNNLGNRLAEAGDKQGALTPAREAVEHYRALAETDPAACRPNLAASLTNLGDRLAETGEIAAALAAAQEAAAIRRTLAEADPAAHLPSLAASLTSLGNRLAEAGDVTGALNSTQEAVNYHRALAAADPAAYLADLAASLHNLGIRLATTGDIHGAIAAGQEAVARNRALAEAAPAAHLPDLAASLNSLGGHLSKTGDTQIALTSLQEGVAIRRALVKDDPAAYLPDLAASLNDLGKWLASGGDKRGALMAGRESVDHYRVLVAAVPIAYVPRLASSLWTLAAGQIIDSGPRSEALGEALKSVQEACELYENLTQQNAPRFENLLQVARRTEATILQRRNQP